MTDDLKRLILSSVADDLATIETALLDNLTPQLTLVSDIAGHLLFSGGKRLRPLLFLLSSRLCGYEQEYAVTFSTIFEYLHAATLLHDDVVDKADMRRGRQAAHSKWGSAEVVLTGDFLLARSLSIAAKTQQPRIIDVIAGITEAMSQGEIDQLIKKGDLNLTQDQYLAVIERKTAVLIQGACRSGAILANADLEKESALADYGYHLGIAFQMADDLLDYTADAQSMGKNPGADIREGKLTLPLILALQAAGASDRAWMEAMIKNPDFNLNEFQQLVQKLHQYKGIEDTRQKALDHSNQAKKSLELFPESRPRNVLMMLADYAVYRQQ